MFFQRLSPHKLVVFCADVTNEAQDLKRNFKVMFTHVILYNLFKFKLFHFKKSLIFFQYCVSSGRNVSAKKRYRMFLLKSKFVKTVALKRRRSSLGLHFADLSNFSQHWLKKHATSRQPELQANQLYLSSAESTTITKTHVLLAEMR